MEEEEEANKKWIESDLVVVLSCLFSFAGGGGALCMYLCGLRLLFFLFLFSLSLLPVLSGFVFFS